MKGSLDLIQLIMYISHLMYNDKAYQAGHPHFPGQCGHPALEQRCMHLSFENFEAYSQMIPNPGILLTLAYFGPICPGMDQVMMSQHHRLVALYVG